MSKKEPLKLILCLHNHQPEGNFRHIYEEGFLKTYKPFLDVYEEFEGLKMNFHYSGSLLKYLEEFQPAFIKRLAGLRKKGRVEFLGAGFYEPILSIIPEEDSVQQIDLSRQFIKKHFNQDIRGLWLTERIWEPQVPQIFKKAGVEFTVVDDHHFTLVGFDKEKLDGFYTTEYNGYKLKVFSGSEKLRYLLPFKTTKELDAYLKKKHEEGIGVLVYADDGEKFGMWPGTYKWVYEEEWLKKFFQYLEENKEWVQTSFFSEVLNTRESSGFVYLKSASYREMLEWSGGFFRNFFTKYEESNFMHKRMFYVSSNIDSIKSKSAKVSKARDYLYRAQANDAYWHGVFGGLYLNHLRYSVFSNLINAENVLEELSFQEKNTSDIDYDGRPESIIKNKQYKLIFSKTGGACLEWDLRTRAINIANVLRRREEPYHEVIFKKKDEPQDTGTDSGNTQSIHEEKKIKDKDIKEYVVYDRYRKGCFTDFLFSHLDLDSYRKQDFLEKVPLPALRYDVKDISKTKVVLRCETPDKFRMDKDIILDDAMVRADYRFGYPDAFKKCFFGVEFNFSIFNKSWLQGQVLEDKDEFVLEDEWFGLKVVFKAGRKCNMFIVPVFTVSDSEGGIEKTYQHVSVLLWQKMKERDLSFQIEVV